MKIVFRRYASLYFIIGVDEEEVRDIVLYSSQFSPVSE